MRIYVYVYICMSKSCACCKEAQQYIAYVYKNALIYVYMCIHVHICLTNCDFSQRGPIKISRVHSWTYIYMCIYMHIYAYMFTTVCALRRDAHLYVYICAYIWMFILTYVWQIMCCLQRDPITFRVCTWIYIYMGIYVHIFECVYTHMFNKSCAFCRETRWHFAFVYGYTFIWKYM